ncbi:MAG: hypothetical protein OQJ81_07895, partial [Melioribacteraceae bacterium]|nr:hypothetical protein [Melioribacteraceae bacterium]
MKNMFFFLIFLTNFANISFGQWVQSDGPYGGHIRCIIPQEAYLYVGTFGQGIFYSSDNGENWASINEGLGNLHVNSLAINDSVVVAGTWGGVYLSTDKGGNWKETDSALGEKETDLALGEIVSAVAIYDSTILAGTWRNGLFISSDYGQSWISLNNGIPDSSDVVSIFIKDNKIYTCFNEGIFYSTDSCNSWTNMGLNNVYIRSVTLDDNNLFVCTDNGVYKYAENDSNWVQLGSSSKQVMAIAVKDNILYGGGIWRQGIFFSGDGGETWESMNSGLSDHNITALTVKDEFLIAGTEYGGIYIYDEGNNSWITKNNGLIYANTQVLYADNNTNMGNHLYAGTYHNGIFVLGEGSDSWSSLNNGIVNANINAIVSFQDEEGNDNIFIGTDNSEIYRSTDYGTSWTRADSGIKYFTSITSMVVCGSKIYAGTRDGIYSSDNNGVFWIKDNHDIVNAHTVLSMAVKDTNIYAGQYNGGIIVSSDDGNNWKEINNGLSNLFVNSIITSDDNLYVGTHNGGVFTSSDDGEHWKQVNKGLSDLGITALLAVDSSVFSCAGNSVYYSIDNGNNWILANEFSGFVHSLAYFNSNLFVGTNEGLWKHSLKKLITSVEDKKKNLTSCFLLEQNYPNPFNPITTISYQLPEAGLVTLKVYNALGKEVATLINAYKSRGSYNVVFNGSNFASG